MIIACPRMTVSYSQLPPMPPPEAHQCVEAKDCANLALPPSPPTTPPPAAFVAQPSEWSLYEPASKQGSAHSSSSADSGYESDPNYHAYPQPGFSFYGNVVPYGDTCKNYYPQQAFNPAVTAY